MSVLPWQFGCSRRLQAEDPPVLTRQSVSLLIPRLFAPQEVIILILSIAVNGNHVSPINVVGMIICLFGLSAHVVNKGIHECKQAKKSQRRPKGRAANANGLMVIPQILF